MKVHYHSDFDFNRSLLNVGGAHPIKNNIKHFVKYNKDPLIIQTPLLYIPFGVQEYNTRNTLDVSFHNIKYSKQTDHFYNTVNAIHNTILDYIDTTDKTIFGIKHSVGYPPLLKLNVEKTSVWNNKREQLSLEDIKKNSFGSLIINLEGVYINEKNIGFIWNVLQIRIKEEINLDTYAFVDDPVPSMPSAAVALPIDKYSRMLKMGISTRAVEQKKLLDGVKTPSAADLLSGLSGLKKVTVSQKKKKFKKPDTNQFVIDQDTILGALKGLKKI
jgi:hypothetical protein